MLASVGVQISRSDYQKEPGPPQHLDEQRLTVEPEALVASSDRRGVSRHDDVEWLRNASVQNRLRTRGRRVGG